MKVEFTSAAFPSTGGLKKDCGLPFGLTVTPLAENEQLVAPTRIQPTPPKAIPRCNQCFAYINVYCHLGTRTWHCALCGAQNTFSLDYHNSYMTRSAEHQPLMLLSHVVDLPLAAPPIDEDEAESAQARLMPEGFPVVIALIDTACSEEGLDNVKNALAASLEVLPSESLLGLITFDDRVRVYDVKGNAPCCRTVRIVDGVPLLAALEDVLPLEQFLAPVGLYKDMFLKTLDLIEPTPSVHLANGEHSISAPAQASVSRTDEEAVFHGQAYGTVLQAVLQYVKPLGSDKEDPDSKEDIIHSARIISFLAGPPMMGLGNLQPYIMSKDYLRTHKPSKGDEKILQKAGSAVSEFYNQTAIVAASLGVVLDLFFLSNQSVCLELLSSLAEVSGGGLWHYGSVAEAMITQDLFRHLSVLHAQGCLMRVRLPPQLAVSKSYGRLLRDSLYTDLYHIQSCDPYETFSLDLEHKAELIAPATLQVAFQYTLPVFAPIEGAGSLFRLQKRLRVMTVQMPVTHLPLEIYSKVHAEVVAAFLMHKVLVAVKAEGTLKAAVLLQDWLIILAACYKRHIQTEPFITSEAFQPLIRLVYGLLRSPILLGRFTGSSDDTQVFLKHLWMSLPPSDLQRAIYPILMSFWSPEQQACPCHSLSRVAMKLSQAPIFLLDGYDSVIVLYTRDAKQPYPPAPSSLIRQSINAMRQGRKRAPHYLIVKEDDSGVQSFTTRLLDEPLQLETPLEGESGAAFNGYLSFVDWIKCAADGYAAR